MSKYDGSWGNDPLDLRCIRLDAEMEEMSKSKPIKIQKKKEKKPKYCGKPVKDQKRTIKCSDGTVITVTHFGRKNELIIK